MVPSSSGRPGTSRWPTTRIHSRSSSALMMLLLTLSLIFLIKAVGGGRWRHWLLFGAAEFLCFVSYMGSAQFIILLNIIIDKVHGIQHHFFVGVVGHFDTFELRLDIFQQIILF